MHDECVIACQVVNDECVDGVGNAIEEILNIQQIYMVLHDYEEIVIPPDSLNFSLMDLNPSSETYGENIGPQYFHGKVSLYYFPYSET